MNDDPHLTATFALDGDPPTAHLGKWRLYVEGNVPPFLRQHLNGDGEFYPLDEPDFAEIERYLGKVAGGCWDRWGGRAGSVSFMAKGDGALGFACYLLELLRDAAEDASAGT